ncbi:MAG: transposase [Syntrophus sp. (in: bacteria)]|nr:transposase [Syntrophus sp. (in: bacteria)]
MARPLRIQYEHAFYHITGRGNERKKIFYSKTDYNKFKEYIKEVQIRFGFILHAYVLMGNHYHLIGETPRANLSAIMHSINGAYTTYFNKKRKRSGHLFQGRYKAILIDHDSYLLELSRYIHLNPVKAGMVEKPEDYAFSSYASYIFPDKEDMVSRGLIWNMISTENAPILYKAFVEKAISAEENPFKNLYGGMILGKKQFIKDALSTLKKDFIQKDDTSARRSLKTSISLEEIVEAIARTLHIAPQEITSRKGAYRNLALYLARKHTGLMNREIGQFFGNISHSAVAKAHKRFEDAMALDKTLCKDLDRVVGAISNVKG